MNIIATLATVVVLLVVFVVVSAGLVVAATAWSINMNTATNLGEAQSNPTPAAPASPTVACNSSTSKVVILNWTAVPNATGYVTQQAATATGTYSNTPTQPSGTAVTASVTETNGTYYYKVYAVVGTNWNGTAVNMADNVGTPTNPGYVVIIRGRPMCTDN